MAEKKSFILYYDNLKQIDMLTDEQAGKLFKALYKFSVTGEETEFDDLAVKIMFSFIADNIRRDTTKYDEVCKRRSENGKKGGRPPKAEKANGFSENQIKAKKADNDNDIDNDNVNDNEIEKDKDNDNEIEKDNENEKGKENENCHRNFASLFTTATSFEINAFLENFNNICKSFNPVNKISDTDRKNVSEIILNFTENEIIETMNKIEKSSFLKGKKNNPESKYKDWKANFSWLIKYDHFLNAYNGNYDNNSDDFDASMYEIFVNDFDNI